MYYSIFLFQHIVPLIVSQVEGDDEIVEFDEDLTHQLLGTIHILRKHSKEGRGLENGISPPSFQYKEYAYILGGKGFQNP